jgi:hypothetical protein
MATPLVVPSVETLEQLSEIYLYLWRQLENVAENNKWLEIRPENNAALQERVRSMVDSLSPAASSLLSSDFRKTQELLLSGPHVNATEVAAFREYLRDNGLRYAQIADSMIPDNLAVPL